MAKTIATKYKGIRYREHKTRKHGVRKDRYHYIRYRIGGKLKEEGWGWESDSFTAKGAFLEREKIMKAIKAGDEIATLGERREEATRLRVEKEVAQAIARKAEITFGNFFEGVFTEHRDSKKLKPELSLYNHWIKPIIGNKTFASITALDMAKVKRQALKDRVIKKKVKGGVETVTEKGKSMRTVEYCYSTVRMVFNKAREHGIYAGPHPITKAVRQGIRYDNKKVRYLTTEEADALLVELKPRSRQTHDMAILALYCGMRAGECFALDWCNVNMEDKTITLLDTKNTKTRNVVMPERVWEMFSRSEMGKGNTAVFATASGKRIKQISKTFTRAVDTLKLNDDVTDRRNKVTFHTCRHSFASWLAIDRVDLYTIQKLLGHQNIEMTMRYAHLCPDNFSHAADVLTARGRRREKSESEKVVNM